MCCRTTRWEKVSKMCIRDRKIAGAQVRTHAALLAGRAVNPPGRLHGTTLLLDQRMVLVKNDKAFVLFGDITTEIGQQRSHHRATVNDRVIFKIFNAGKFQHVQNRRSYRHLNGNMVRNIAGQRDVLFRHTLSVGRFINIQCRFHIADYTAHKMCIRDSRRVLPDSAAESTPPPYEDAELHVR